MPWLLSKTNTQNAVMYRMASPLGTASRKEVYTLTSDISFARGLGKADDCREQVLTPTMGSGSAIFGV
jgi:hypothetical protein